MNDEQCACGQPAVVESPFAMCEDCARDHETELQVDEHMLDYRDFEPVSQVKDSEL